MIKRKEDKNKNDNYEFLDSIKNIVADSEKKKK